MRDILVVVANSLSGNLKATLNLTKLFLLREDCKVIVVGSYLLI